MRSSAGAMRRISGFMVAVGIMTANEVTTMNVTTPDVVCNWNIGRGAATVLPGQINDGFDPHQLAATVRLWLSTNEVCIELKDTRD